MVADEIDPRRGHEGGEFLQQLMRRQDQVGRTVVPAGFQREREGADLEEAQAPGRQGRTRDVAEQLFEPWPVVGGDAGGRMQ